MEKNHIIYIIAIILSIITIYRIYSKFNSKLNLRSNIICNDSRNCLACNVYIGQSKIGGTYGRGVFAGKNFKLGDIIEIAPYIQDNINNVKGIMTDYVFKKPGTENEVIIVFGYGSMYNHSDKPNTDLGVDETNFVIMATNDIKKDEEIFISYGPGYWVSRNIDKK